MTIMYGWYIISNFDNGIVSIKMHDNESDCCKSVITSCIISWIMSWRSIIQVLTKQQEQFDQ